MKPSITHLLLITLLSALSLSVAFFLPDSLGFLIIVSFVLLFYSFLAFSQKQRLQWVYAGSLWGSVVFGSHFIWLYVLLATKSNASSMLALGLYLFVVVYATATAVVWFFITGYLLQKSNRLFIRCATVGITTWLCFLFYDRYSLFFMGKSEGYPFFNPLIPLARYALVMRVFSFLCGVMYGREVMPPERCYNLIYLKPAPEHVRADKNAVAQHVYHQLATSISATGTESPVVLVAPESFFSFPLNCSEDVCRLWQCVLPKNFHLLLGSQYLGDQKDVYQAVYHICKKNIVGTHRKKHCVAFVEKMPPFFKKCTILRTLFLHNHKDLTEFQDKDVFKTFRITPDQGVIPLLCSEFFYESNVRDLLNTMQNDDTIRRVFFFVNDSWFVGYFRKIMENLTYVKATQLGVSITWIGHFSCKQISVV